MTFAVSVLLAFIVAGLLVERHFAEREHRRERAQLHRLVLARHLPEYATIERMIGEKAAGGPSQREPDPPARPRAEPLAANGDSPPLVPFGLSPRPGE